MAERTLLHTFLRRSRDDAARVAISEFGGGSCTWSQWDQESRAFAAALIDSGCMPGEVVAILAGNSLVWPIADIGALMAGCVSVGVYATNAPAQVHEALKDCGARVVVVDHADQLGKILDVRKSLPNLRLIVSAAQSKDHAVVTWPDWLKRGRAALPRVSRELNNRILDATADDIAVLIYTSGVGGPPKGARISHRYLSASAESIRNTLALTSADTTLSFLPYCHAAERIFGHYTRIHVGMSVTLLEDAAQLWSAAGSVEPTVFGGSPRFYQQIFEALQAQRAALSPEERAAWDRAEALGRTRSQLLRTGRPADPELERSWQTATALPRAAIEQMVGTRLRVAITGGGTLPHEVAETLAAFGLTVLNAYGLTEHLCVAMQRPGGYDFQSAGVTMEGSTLRISETGEIQVMRSDLTFSGYHNKTAETAAAFTEDKAWLRTGDVGYVDGAGRLHVTGREKEVIALTGGRQVAPAPIERQLAASPWIGQAVLFGTSRDYLCALLVLRNGVVEQWARAHGFRMDEYITLEPALLREVQAEIDRVNEQLSAAEQIRRFAILPGELSVERNELTVTMKVRRDVVEERYRGHIESLYL